MLGARGLVGSHVARASRGAGLEVVALDRAACDITDAIAIARALDAVQPDAIVNAAAFTAVDAAEDQVDASYAANVRAPALLAEAARRRGAWLLHYSTDFVYGDDRPGERDETEPPTPRGVYACHKAEGERAVLDTHPGAAVARVGNVWGEGGRNLAARLRGLLEARTPLRLDRERRCTPTSATAIAAQTLALLPERPGGILHMTCEGETTWYGFAVAMAAGLGLADPAIEPVASAELAMRVPRPSVVLAKNALRRLGLHRMPHWHEALSAALPTR